MNTWKICLCVAVWAVALTNGNYVENGRLITKELDLPKLLPPTQVNNLVNILTRARESESTIVNDEIDGILTQLNDHIIASQLDPSTLENQGFEFKFKFLFITYTGEMTLKNGWLQGLGTLERASDCALTTDSASDLPSMHLSLPVKFSTLKFNYKYTLKLMGIGPSGDLDGTIENSQFKLDLKLNYTTLIAEIENYKLIDIGDVSVHFTGLIFIDAIVSAITNITINILEGVFEVLLYDNWIKKAIIRIIELYNQSICTATGFC